MVERIHEPVDGGRLSSRRIGSPPLLEEKKSSIQAAKEELLAGLFVTGMLHVG